MADGIFKCIFLNENLNFKWYFIEMCSLWSNSQYVIIGSDNGLAPDRRQAIIWTNDGLVYWHKCVTRPQFIGPYAHESTLAKVMALMLSGNVISSPSSAAYMCQWTW